EIAAGPCGLLLGLDGGQIRRGGGRDSFFCGGHAGFLAVVCVMGRIVGSCRRAVLVRESGRFVRQSEVVLSTSNVGRASATMHSALGGGANANEPGHPF